MLCCVSVLKIVIFSCLQTILFLNNAVLSDIFVVLFNCYTCNHPLIAPNICLNLSQLTILNIYSSKDFVLDNNN